MHYKKMKIEIIVSKLKSRVFPKVTGLCQGNQINNTKPVIVTSDGGKGLASSRVTVKIDAIKKR
jgi:hypothetical protein